ncbi:hypothetical protein BDV93DRAFT_547205 [Ceratobasidium sp. AG-I]|nr:hypothetical protein BDV93DRAFT_547205 [Ceratobasidium sp. AG-I]
MSNLQSRDSPTRPRTTTSSQRGTTVESSREVLLQDTPEIPEVTFESLLLAVTPAIPELTEARILASLITRGAISNARPGWTCLAVNPASKDQIKGEVLAPLREMFDQVLLAANITQPEISFKLNGSTPLHSDPKNSSQPDAYLQLSAPSFDDFEHGRDRWVDVIMPIEFKKKLNNANCLDVVWQMHHIMRCDPRRRFVFGMTIENTSARFWFHDRCDIVASDIFDIQENWRSLARLFLRLARASHAELGYDSRCRAVPTQLYCYDFLFTRDEDGATNETTYRTVDIISDLGATSLLGHATRVWSVRKLSQGQPGEHLYALKDVWPHDDREPEHALVHMIKAARPEFAMHYLTISNAEFVLALYNGQLTDDHTFHVIRREQHFAATGRKLSTSDSSSVSDASSQSQAKGRRGVGSPGKSKGSRHSQASSSSRHPPMVEALAPQGHRDVKYLNLYPRRHYRMVSREVGTSIYRMRHFPHALCAIQGALRGLYGMHLAGFNHRDVSAGNILFYQGPDDQEPRGIIMDLEYAKRYDNKSNCHDVKTGTAAFMAVEVSAGSYIYKPSSLPLSRRIDVDGKRTRMPDLAFRQNSLHDYESMWWIALWLLFSLFEPNRLRTKAYISNYEKVFNSSADTRWTFWDRTDKFELLSEHLDSAAETDYLYEMATWAATLKGLYQQSYLAGGFEKQDPVIIQQTYELGVEALDKLAGIVSSYANQLLFFTELEAAPPTPIIHLSP